MNETSKSIPLRIQPDETSRYGTNPSIRGVRVGSLTIGGGAPVIVQSMCSTDTRDVKATLNQIHRLTEAGCELVRVAVPDAIASAALKDIVAGCDVPIVADIHFHYKRALEAISAGVAKVRINPGNIGSDDRVQAVAEAAGEHNVSIRVGVNSGSMPEDILERDDFKVTPQGMVDAAMREIELLDKFGFHDVVVALKASDVRTMIEANRLFRRNSNLPLHLGVTEAGLPGYGTVKSAIGIGSLLLDSIGETIRVSLTTDPVEEIEACWWILESTNTRRRGPELVACPTCGRLEIDLFGTVSKVKEIIKGISYPIKVSVMGCVVNGIGEARDADIALVGGKGRGMILRQGKIVKSTTEENLLMEFQKELSALLKEREATETADEG